MMLAGVQEPEVQIESSTRTLRERLGVLGKNARAMYCVVLVGSTEKMAKGLSRLLDDAPVVRSEGRMHPVEVRWGRASQPGEHLATFLLRRTGGKQA